MKSNPIFEVSDSLLKRACAFNGFSLMGRENEMVLFGIRGALPRSKMGSLADYSPHMGFRKAHFLQRMTIDYRRPRCVIGQWLPNERKIAIFPGSTVPNLILAQKNGLNLYQFNCLLPGFYDYIKGPHPKDKSAKGMHRALRANGTFTFRRANYTLGGEKVQIDYGPTSVIDAGTSGDNIHCAGNTPKIGNKKASSKRRPPYSLCLSDTFNSYGCQVVVGSTTVRNGTNDAENGQWNAWQVFIENIYDTQAKNQDAFKYLLLDSVDVQKIDSPDPAPDAPTQVRHGSSGYRVERLQSGLNAKRSIRTGSPYYSGSIDGEFQEVTARALMAYQKDAFNGRAYGFAGHATFKRLGVPFRNDGWNTNKKLNKRLC